MKKSNRHYSNLDLKLLDVNFITINDNQIYLTETLQSVKKSKISQLPSLLKSNNLTNLTNDNSISLINKNDKFKTNVYSPSSFESAEASFLQSGQFTCLNSQNKIDSTLLNDDLSSNDPKTQVHNLIQSIKKKHHSNTKSLPIINMKSILSPQQQEIQKYRKKIGLLKLENSLIHHEISSLYSAKISQNQRPQKQVRRIQPFTEGVKSLQEPRKHLISDKLSKLSRCDQPESSLPKLSNKMFSFYQNLVDQTPYKQELAGIHKKLMNNNLHKNFEYYLIHAGKRVPEFLKRLRA